MPGDNIGKMSEGLPNTPLPGMEQRLSQLARDAANIQRQVDFGDVGDRREFEIEKQKIVDYQNRNDARVAQLGIKLDPALVVLVRLQVLLDFHLGDMDGGKPEMSRWPRLAYERRVQDEFAKKLDEAEKKIREAQLTQGVIPPGAPINGHRLYLPGQN